MRRIGAALRRPGVRFARRLELADVEAGQRRLRLERAAALVAHGRAEALRDGERRATVRDDGAIGEAGGRLRRRALVVVEGAFPFLGATEVMGEGLVELGEALGIQLLDGEPDGAVQLDAALPQHAVVRHVVRQRVLEHVGELGMRRLLVDQLERAQLVDVRAHASPPPP